MAYEPKPNTGSLFKNDRKESDTHPDYKGSALIGGVDHWLDAWINETNDGRKYMSLKFKVKETRVPDGSRGAPIHQASGYVQQASDLEDDVPFISADPSLEARVR